jgi:hypothetical protein
MVGKVDDLSLYDSVRDVTWDDWRLPTTQQPDPSCSGQIDPGFPWPLFGNQLNCTGSEMGHLFNVDGVTSSTPGPFISIQSSAYWSGTEYAPSTTSAWYFGFGSGRQLLANKSSPNFNGFAVRNGDVGAVVPIPAAVWLLGSALGLLGWIRRKAA